MHNDKFFVKDTMKIKDRKTGILYDCFTESVELNFDGKYYLRYNIGINGYHEWHNVCCEYSNELFNRDYEVISL